jgi:hypothetical protein
MRNWATILAVIALLAACDKRIGFTPAVSGGVVDSGLLAGEFVIKAEGRQTQTWHLNERQMKEVVKWIDNHRSNMSALLSSPPPPSFSIVLNHEDHSRTQVDLFDVNENWRHVVVVHRTDPSENGTMEISTEDRTYLLDLVKQGDPAIIQHGIPLQADAASGAC